MSKEFILVRNEQGNGDILLRVANILSVRDMTTIEGTFKGGYIACERDRSDDTDFYSSQSAAEIFALIEGEQEKPPCYTVSDEEQKRAIEEYFSPPVSSSDAQRTIEAVATLWPDLRSELERLTGETWAVRLFPANANFDETGVFTVRWLFRCYQEKTQFQYALPEHFLSYWVNMSGVARERWVIESAQAVIAKWKTSSGY